MKKEIEKVLYDLTEIKEKLQEIQKEYPNDDVLQSHISGKILAYGVVILKLKEVLK